MRNEKKIRRKIGDVIVIRLGDGSYCYGRVLREPMIAVYNLRNNEPLAMEVILAAPVAFVLFVMNSAVTAGIWPVIGNVPLTPDLLHEPVFFKKDSLSGKFSIYRDSTGEETPATREECRNIECATVWEPQHVVDRLQDYFAGRPNKFVESLRA